jgi:hypothetical protein
MYVISNSYEYGKLVYIYDLDKHELIKNIDQNENLLQNPKYVLCFKIENKDDFLYNDAAVSFNSFPWKTYYKINKELVSTNIHNNTKNTAWHHWTYHGKNEERSFSYINNTNDHRARFGNLFFLNMCLHLFSQKYHLKSSYKYEKQFNQLGIYFYKGSKKYKKNLLLTDYNFESLLKSDVSPRNIIINNNVWFHKNGFCRLIQRYFTKNNLFERIRSHNKYKNRYNNNNDLFIHVRLGDVTGKTNHLLEYYIKVIDSNQFSKGYISSDSINHDICTNLIKKYNLKIINKSEVETIMFGSTCKNIILSGGTFSWLIGFLAGENANIFYPKLKETWYGDIFSFSNWNYQTF